MVSEDNFGMGFDESEISGCSTCAAGCGVNAAMQLFSPGINSKLDDLTNAVMEFKRSCDEKASGDGSLKIDVEILDKLKAIKGMVTELQEHTGEFPQIPYAISGILQLHGNSLIHKAFLG